MGSPVHWGRCTILSLSKGGQGKFFGRVKNKKGGLNFL